MRKMVFYCDRCGKQVTDKLKQLGHLVIETENGFSEGEEWAAELCPECFEEIDSMITWMMMHPQIHFSNGEQIKPKE